MTALAAIVLAAGQGTRMRSRVPKVLHPLGGRPLIDHVLDALGRAGVEHRVVVTGHGGDLVEAALDGRAATARQDPQLGTADAVRVGLERVPATARQVVVAMGDAPLVTPELFRALVREQAEGEATVALLAARMDDPSGYGRIVRGADGGVAGIVEDADADAQTRAIDEINAGTYCFEAAWLRANIGQVPASAGGEFYLTDLVALAVGAGRRVALVSAPRAEVALGINDRVQLSQAETLMRRQIAERHMLAGVSIVDPATTFIGAQVEIAADVRIEPYSTLEGATTVASDAVIGPGTHLRDAHVGPRSRVNRSVIEESTIAEDCEIGPWTHVRPRSEIGPGCRIGNFAEIKQSRIGAGTDQHHFSYVGDAEVGERVNLGAGIVTVNYDGAQKNRTTIGDGAFIGSDSMLIAPITIGPGGFTGAGSVVTRDVPAGKRVVGVPARPIEARRRPRQPPDDAPAAAGADRNTQTGGGSAPPDA